MSSQLHKHQLHKHQLHKHIMPNIITSSINEERCSRGRLSLKIRGLIVFLRSCRARSEECVLACNPAIPVLRKSRARFRGSEARAKKKKRFLPPRTVNSLLQLFISEEINIVCVTKRLARCRGNACITSFSVLM